MSSRCPSAEFSVSVILLLLSYRRGQIQLLLLQTRTKLTNISESCVLWSPNNHILNRSQSALESFVFFILLLFPCPAEPQWHLVVRILVLADLLSSLFLTVVVSNNSTWESWEIVGLLDDMEGSNTSDPCFQSESDFLPVQVVQGIMITCGWWRWCHHLWSGMAIMTAKFPPRFTLDWTTPKMYNTHSSKPQIWVSR
jgi:hypothetical protein